MIKRIFAIVTSTLIFLSVFPITVLAITNYGDGIYGDGVYGVGGTPVPLTNAAAPQVTDTAPSGTAPWLYEANANDGNSITIRFTNWQTPVDHFALEYGTTSGQYQFAVGNIGGKDISSYTIRSLSPNTTYYFRVRAGNGAATGTWSNELSAKTLWVTSINNLNIVDTKIEQVPAPSPSSAQSPEGNVTVTQGLYKVNVKVNDTKGNLIENATITLHSSPQTAKTNNNGVATFTDVEAGNHLLQIAYNSYQGEQSINLSGDAKEINITITIELKSAFLSPKVLAVVGALVLIIGVLVFILIKKNKLRKL